MPKNEQSEKRFKIMHTMVGPFTQGRVISEAQLKAVATSGYDHLLSSGAIALEKDEPVDGLATPVSPENKVGEALHNLESGKTGKTPPAKTADTDPATDVMETKDDLMKSSKPELTTRAQELGIDTTGLTKDDLADAILAKKEEGDTADDLDADDDDDDDDTGTDDDE